MATSGSAVALHQAGIYTVSPASPPGSLQSPPGVVQRADSQLISPGPLQRADSHVMQLGSLKLRPFAKYSAPPPVYKAYPSPASSSLPKSPSMIVTSGNSPPSPQAASMLVYAPFGHDTSSSSSVPAGIGAGGAANARSIAPPVATTSSAEASKPKKTPKKAKRSRHKSQKSCC